jgi:hypothetical protein
VRVSDDNDNGDSTNGHGRHVVTVSDEEQSNARRLAQLAMDLEHLEGSLNAFRVKFNRHAELIEDFMRTISSQLNEVLNNRDGYGVLKRLSALEERVTEKPKRVRAGRK